MSQLREPRGRASAARMARAAALAAVVAVGVSIAACSSGDGNGGPAEPTGIALWFTRTRVQVTRETDITANLTYPYRREDPPDCDWYVDGTLGGSSQKGTITQANPATYTAPSVVPAGGRVVITAVSRVDSTFTASDTLRVVFTIKYVDADDGSDTAAGGPWAAPFKTISYAMDHTAAGDTVFVMPGRYDETLGEDQNVYVATDVTLRGSHRDSVLISTTAWGGIVGLNNGSTLESVTIENVESNHAIYTTAATAWIRDVRTVGLYGHSAIRIIGPGTEVVVEDCEIVNDVNPGEGRGFEIITDTHSTIRGTTVSGWGYGIFINTASDPLIEGCTITDNHIGIISFGGTGDPITQPDLGGGHRGSVGGNLIRANTESGLKNQCATDVWAQGNTWHNDPPVEGPPYPCDFENSGGGSVVWY
jgi:parallel beta-helix repeat protein